MVVGDVSWDESSHLITRIDSFVCDTGLGRTQLFVRVHIDDGRAGTGEASQNDLDPAVLAAVTELRSVLVGRSAVDMIEALATRLANDRLDRPWFAAIGAVEQALWDLLGQIAGLPVYKLHGGAVRQAVPCYATLSAGLSDHSPDALAAEAKRCVGQGLDGVKIVPFVDRASRSGNWSEAGLDRVAAVREAIGPESMLMIECAFGLNYDELITVGDRLEAYDCAWIEAPLPWDDAALLRRAGDRLRTPLASGELAFGRRHCRPLIERQAVSVLQPDVKWAGGIAEAKKIASWAETYQLRIAPHNNSGLVATLASAHLAATLPNLFALEVPSRWPQWQRQLMIDSPWWGDGPLVVDRLGAEPGLGMSFDERFARTLTPED